MPALVPQPAFVQKLLKLLEALDGVDFAYVGTSPRSSSEHRLIVDLAHIHRLAEALVEVGVIPPPPNSTNASQLVDAIFPLVKDNRGRSQRYGELRFEDDWSTNTVVFVGRPHRQMPGRGRFKLEVTNLGSEHAQIDLLQYSLKDRAFGSALTRYAEVKGKIIKLAFATFQPASAKSFAALPADTNTIARAITDGSSATQTTEVLEPGIATLESPRGRREQRRARRDLNRSLRTPAFRQELRLILSAHDQDPSEGRALVETGIKNATQRLDAGLVQPGDLLSQLSGSEEAAVHAAMSAGTPLETAVRAVIGRREANASDRTIDRTLPQSTDVPPDTTDRTEQPAVASQPAPSPAIDPATPIKPPEPAEIAERLRAMRIITLAELEKSGEVQRPRARRRRGGHVERSADTDITEPTSSDGDTRNSIALPETESTNASHLHGQHIRGRRRTPARQPTQQAEPADERDQAAATPDRNSSRGSSTAGKPIPERFTPVTAEKDGTVDDWQPLPLGRPPRPDSDPTKPARSDRGRDW